MADLDLIGRLKRVLIGKSRDLTDKSLFHRLSLIAFFAWVGLGSRRIVLLLLRARGGL